MVKNSTLIVVFFCGFLVSPYLYAQQCSYPVLHNCQINCTGGSSGVPGSTMYIDQVCNGQTRMLLQRHNGDAFCGLPELPSGPNELDGNCALVGPGPPYCGLYAPNPEQSGLQIYISNVVMQYTKKDVLHIRWDGSATDVCCRPGSVNLASQSCYIWPCDKPVCDYPVSFSYQTPTANQCTGGQELSCIDYEINPFNCADSNFIAWAQSIVPDFYQLYCAHNYRTCEDCKQFAGGSSSGVNGPSGVELLSSDGNIEFVFDNSCEATPFVSNVIVWASQCTCYDKHPYYNQANVIGQCDDRDAGARCDTAFQDSCLVGDAVYMFCDDLYACSDGTYSIDCDGVIAVVEGDADRDELVTQNYNVVSMAKNFSPDLDLCGANVQLYVSYLCTVDTPDCDLFGGANFEYICQSDCVIPNLNFSNWNASVSILFSRFPFSFITYLRDLADNLRQVSGSQSDLVFNEGTYFQITFPYALLSDVRQLILYVFYGLCVAGLYCKFFGGRKK